MGFDGPEIDPMRSCQRGRVRPGQDQLKFTTAVSVVPSALSARFVAILTRCPFADSYVAMR